ncbi:hypothetical protein [Streptomyces sp. NPDC058294]|uniref:hypothetical protein n=1 Tax=Streptomyces sp. NPDC058294 TaxID=3346430 RepID=UPI0036F135CD
MAVQVQQRKGIVMQVKDLQPGNKEIRIQNSRGSLSGSYEDGVVRKVTCVNADEDIWAVTLYQSVYDSEKVVYPRGSDPVVEPTRHMNAMLAAEGDHEREMKERADKQGFAGA